MLARTLDVQHVGLEPPSDFTDAVLLAVFAFDNRLDVDALRRYPSIAEGLSGSG
jgi:hypothetical protein